MVVAKGSLAAGCEYDVGFGGAVNGCGYLFAAKVSDPAVGDWGGLGGLVGCHGWCPPVRFLTAYSIPLTVRCVYSY